MIQALYMPSFYFLTNITDSLNLNKRQFSINNKNNNNNMRVCNMTAVTSLLTEANKYKTIQNSYPKRKKNYS